MIKLLYANFYQKRNNFNEEIKHPNQSAEFFE
jgi:hypothetical protein